MANLSGQLYLPFLVLLESPVPFLVVVTIFTFFNFAVAAKQMKAEKNAFVLTIYPLLFHLCFIVFYYSTSNGVLVYTEIICLLVLLLGSLHNTISIIATIIYTIYRIIRKLCKSNKIEPESETKTSAK
jgi:hypothetical protein